MQQTEKTSEFWEAVRGTPVQRVIELLGVHSEYCDSPEVAEALGVLAKMRDEVARAKPLVGHWRLRDAKSHTLIGVAHDYHTNTTFELQDDGTVYASTNGDGESLSAVEAFQKIAEALVSEPISVGVEHEHNVRVMAFERLERTRR